MFDGALIATTEGRILEANALACSLLGYDALAHYSVDDLLADSSDHTWDAIRASAEMRRSTLEVSLRQQSGATFWAEIGAHRLDSQRLALLLRDINRRKLAEIALQRSEERFRHISYGTSDAQWDWDLDRNIIWWGEGLRTGLGYSLAGMTSGIEWWSSLVHAGDRERVDASMREALDGTTQIWSSEYRFLRADCSYADILDRGYIVRDERGVATRMVGVMIDVSERKQAEEALRASELRYRTLAETSGVGIWQVSPSGETIYANPAMCALLGYRDLNELREHPYESFFARESLRRIHREHRRRTEGLASSYEVTITRPDGTTRTAIAYGAPLFDSDGALHSRLGTFVDVTERKQAEEALREIESRFRQLTDNINEVFWLLDADTRVLVYASPAFERMWGFSLEEAAADPMHWQQAVHPDDRENVRALVADPPSDSFSNEFRLQRADGELRWVRNRAFPVRDGEGRIFRYAGIMEDITDRKEFERHLQHSQKLESLGVLAGGIAHDFNNLLLGILGNADLALLELSPTSPGRKYIEDAVKICQRAAELCNQMLAYSGKGKFVIETIDLCGLVQEMSHLLEVSISKKAVLKYNFASNLPAIEGDATQIRQVIMNLITNASDALEEKSGVIVVSTGAMHCDREYLSETFLDEALEEGDYVYFEVADNGCGMSRETRARVFDPFFTTKFTGRGLGLAAVLGIVRAHHGAIKVYSEQGHGSTVKVLFPVCEQALDMMLDNEIVPELVAAGGTILLVDDEEPIRLVGRKVLERAGYAVLTASDGVEAVAVYREYSDTIAAVVLDMTMPHMSGEETFRELRRIRPDVRVLLSSGYSEGEATHRFAGKGLAGFLQKPYRPHLLVETLAKILAGEIS